MKPLMVRFAGGADGPWRIDRLDAVVGEPLPRAARLAVLEGHGGSPPVAASWVLRGVTTNERYVNQDERAALMMHQQGLGRMEATFAALIPIRKSEAWWELTQDERRKIFEERSRHIATGLEYLPAVARRLHHGRDLGEPFDFLTWFEYAPHHAGMFEELLLRLRQTAEWTYVEREVDIRLVREASAEIITSPNR
jgi:chlorite dismutase